MEEDDDIVVVIVGDNDEGNNQILPIKQEVLDDDDEPRYMEIEELLETAERHGQLIPLENVKQEPMDDYDHYNEENYNTEYIEDYNPPIDDEQHKKKNKNSKKKKQKQPKHVHFDDFVDDVKDEDYKPQFEESDDEPLLKKPRKRPAEILMNKKRKAGYVYFKDIDSDVDDDFDLLSEAESGGEQHAKKRKIMRNPDRLKEKHRYTMLRPSEQRSYVKELREQYPELREDKELLIDTLCEIMKSLKPPLPPKDFYIMNGIDYECTKCGSINSNMPSMTRHWQDSHGERFLNCFGCGVNFRSRTNLYKHEKRCNSPDAVIVLKARSLFIGRRGRGRPFPLTAEQLAKRDILFKKIKYGVKALSRQFQCAECPAQFKTAVGLAAHTRAHRGLRPYRCKLCPAAYTSKSGLSRHKQKHRGIAYTCDHCNRSLHSKHALINHMNIHEPLRKFCCSSCGKRFAQKMALDLHYNKVHLNLPPPCPCQICPKRYPRMSHLKNHMLKAHGMNLITKQMFYKRLPMLSEQQIQEAKIVLKSQHESEFKKNLQKAREAQDQAQLDQNFMQEQQTEDEHILPDQENYHILPDQENDHILPDQENDHILPDQENDHILPDQENYQNLSDQENDQYLEDQENSQYLEDQENSQYLEDPENSQYSEEQYLSEQENDQEEVEDDEDRYVKEDVLNYIKLKNMQNDNPDVKYVYIENGAVVHPDLSCNEQILLEQDELNAERNKLEKVLWRQVKTEIINEIVDNESQKKREVEVTFEVEKL